MARPPKGKPLTLRPIRLDDDVWAECQRLGKEHGTINEGMATAQAALRMQEAQGRMMAESLAREVDEFERRRQETRQRMSHGARAFKAPLLKPSEKKK